MSGEGSVTLWLRLLAGGDTGVARHLWDRFFIRMKHLARQETAPWITGGVYDEEDIALSAFAQFCQTVVAGRYPDLHGREELWRLLATMTVRKAREQARQARALKRGGPVVADRTAVPDLDALPSAIPSPDLMVMMQEEGQRLLGLLEDPGLRELALWKLEGLTNEEAAQEMGYTRRTIQRMLAVIRQTWERDS